METSIKEVKLNNDGFTRAGNYIYEMFENVHIDEESIETVLLVVEQTVAAITESEIVGMI